MVRLAKPGEVNYSQCAILWGSVGTGKFCVGHPSRKPTWFKWLTAAWPTVWSAMQVLYWRKGQPGLASICHIHVEAPTPEVPWNPHGEVPRKLGLVWKLGSAKDSESGPVWVFHGGGQLFEGRVILEVLNFQHSKFNQHLKEQKLFWRHDK